MYCCLVVRFDSELQFSIACLLESLSLMAAPWSSDVYGFMAACAVTGFAMAYIDTGNVIIHWSLPDVFWYCILYCIYTLTTFYNAGYKITCPYNVVEVQNFPRACTVRSS